MDKTMEQLVKDILRLRRRAGVTQQEVSIAAGEPCRTFLAHLEQGRKTHLNLKKLHDVLNVMFKRTGEVPVIDPEVQKILDGYEKRIALLEQGARRQYTPQASKPKKVLNRYEVLIDKIMSGSTEANPVRIHDVVKQAEAAAIVSPLHTESGVALKFSSEKNKTRNSTIEKYIQQGSRRASVLNDMTPEARTKIKFVLKSPGVYYLNNAYPWATLAAPPLQRPLPLTLASKVHCIRHLTEAETRTALENFFKGSDTASGPKRSSGYMYDAVEKIDEKLQSAESVTRSELLDEMKISYKSSHNHPTIPDWELFNRFIDFLGSCGVYAVTIKGDDRVISAVPNRDVGNA